ncbi:MAG: bifunctional adenosylcobinamide kinase/adenosylcobinamide-phosphate guanylyltransferase [Thermoleophilia bacterium]
MTEKSNSNPGAPLTFVTGGARSGKSGFAEQLAVQGGGPVTYIATAEPGDTEMRRRIEEHRRRRPGSWRTVEAPLDLPEAVTAALAGGGTVLVDCLTVYLSNLLLRDERLDLDAASAAAERETGRLAALCSQDGAVAGGSRLIIVSNEVGMGIVPDTELGRIFRDAAGRANQQLAAAAEAVYLCVSGISVRIK